MNIERFKQKWEEIAAANPIPDNASAEELENGMSPEVEAFLEEIGAADSAELAKLLPAS